MKKQFMIIFIFILIFNFAHVTGHAGEDHSEPISNENLLLALSLTSFIVLTFTIFVLFIIKGYLPDNYKNGKLYGIIGLLIFLTIIINVVFVLIQQ